MVDICCIFAFLICQSLTKETKNNKIVNDGLKKQLITVNRIYEINKEKIIFAYEYILRPVIPYTYNYLLTITITLKIKVRPTVNYANNQCWYIIEDDNFKFRIDQYRKDHIPTTGKLIKKESIHKDVSLELWRDYPQK